MAYNQFTTQPPFRFWCQKVLPAVYDESLSYYELLNKVVDYLNTMNTNVQGIEGNFQILDSKFDELKYFVDHYFENVDIQTEINNKLDEMAESGELTAILADTVTSAVDAWLQDNIQPYATPIDDTLTLTNAAAQAKKVGDMFKQTLKYKTVEYDTSIDDIKETGLYFNSSKPDITPAVPIYADCPYFPALIEVCFTSTSSYGWQIVYPYTNGKMPLFRFCNTLGEWSEFVDYNNEYRNIKVKAYSSGTNVANIEMNTACYGYGSNFTGLPFNIDNNDLCYIECVKANTVGNVKFYTVYDCSRNIMWWARAVVGEGNVTTIENWHTVENATELSFLFNEFNIIDSFLAEREKPSSFIYNGVDWYWDESELAYKLQGTAEGYSYCNLYSGALPINLRKGGTYHCSVKTDLMVGDSQYAWVQIYFKRSGVLTDPINVYTESEITIPNDVDDYILYRLYSSQTLDGQTVDNSIYTAFGTKADPKTYNYEYNTYNNTYTIESMSPSLTSDNRYYLASTNDTTDRSNDINTILTNYGTCILGQGIFYANNIVVDNNKTLIGQGIGSTRLAMVSSASGTLINLGTKCSIRNMSLLGWGGAKPNSFGNRHAIEWVGTYNGSTGTTKQNAAISNVLINGFSGYGIHMGATGLSPNQSLDVDNIQIENCYYGIATDLYAEYNRFDNIIITNCTIGCLNNGANNVFTNCGFNSNGTGFKMDIADNTKNNTHGSCVGCTFNHSGNNSGDAININNASMGFVFSGCQIFYGNIKSKDSNAIMVTGCNFGTSVPIYSDNAVVIINSSIFKDAISKNVSNNGLILVNTSYYRDGTAVT